MSSLAAMHLGQHHSDRIERAVLLIPPPPSGLGVDDAVHDYLQSAARADDATRTTGMRRSAGDRLSEVLAVTGDHDAEIMRKDSVSRLLAPIADQLVVTAIADRGPYPMQEAPPLLVTLIERFLA